jgi:aryl-alcohol dehydrogenase-like predicted oxidoreductase
MAYSPLGRGFFAGQVHDAKDMAEGDGRINHPRFQARNLEANLQLLKQFEQIAGEIGATPAQLALAWLIAQGPDVIPIPSNKSRNHLEENIKAADIKLSAQNLNRLSTLFAPGAAAGPRTRDLHRVNV